MDLTLNYTSDSNDIKSQNSEGHIDFILGYEGMPFDLHTIIDNTVTVKIANAEGYIQDIPVDVSSYDDESKYQGMFRIELSDPHIQNLPPDIYYLEVWINVNDQFKQPQRLIFPSDYVLPFTLTANIVNGSNSMPMITFDQIQKDWDSFKKLVTQHEAKTEKMLNDAGNLAGNVNSAVNQYYTFADSVGSNITKASNNLSTVTSVMSDAASGAYGEVAQLTGSAKGDLDTTVNSAENVITHATDGIKTDVNSIVYSGKNDITNKATNINNTTSSAVSLISHSTNTLNSDVEDRLNDINLTVNSANNYVSGFTQNIKDVAGSAKSTFSSQASSANSDLTSNIRLVNNNQSSYSANLSSVATSAYSKINDSTENASIVINGVRDNGTNSLISLVSSADSNLTNKINDFASQAKSGYISVSSSSTNAAGQADLNSANDRITYNSAIAKAYFNQANENEIVLSNNNVSTSQAAATYFNQLANDNIALVNQQEINSVNAKAYFNQNAADINSLKSDVHSEFGNIEAKLIEIAEKLE